MDKDFESIRSKVLKLQALAERGEKGEAINARRLLDQLLAKYGVSLEEIVEAQEEEELYISQRKRNPLCKGYKPMTAETDRARDATGVRRANLPPRTMNFKFYNYGSNNRK